MQRRLALYSDQSPPLTDPIDQRVLDWLSDRATIGYIPSSPDPDRTWFEGQVSYYHRYELTLKFFGLEDEFDESRIPQLLSCDAIHLTGGNTYRFLHWLRMRGMMPLLRQFVLDGGVLIGVSAGAILMTPDIDTSMICGDTLYAGREDIAGLSLVDFAFVPHFDGSDEMAAAVTALQTHTGRTIYVVPDGAAILVDGNSIQLCGAIEWQGNP